MTKKNKTESEAEALESAVKEADFDKGFVKTDELIEHRSVVGMVHRFTVHFAEQLSNYLGKKITVELDQMELIESQSMLDALRDVIYASYSMNNEREMGVVILDYALLDMFIDFLFGYDSPGEAKKEFAFGACSLKIAQEIAQFSLTVFEKVISEYTQFQCSLQRATTSIKDISHQRVAPNCYEIVFRVNVKKLSRSMRIFIPQAIIERIVYGTDMKSPGTNQQDEEALKDQLKNDIIDTTVNLVAVLPAIKLRFNEVLNLKSGDLIPIDDPTQVELCVDNKKLYKAQVGQVNSYRVVKTTGAITN